MSNMSSAELSAWINTHRNMELEVKSSPVKTNLATLACPSFRAARSRPKPSITDTRYAVDMATAGLEALTDIALRDPDFIKITAAMPELVNPLIETAINETRKREAGDWRYYILGMFDAPLLQTLLKGFLKQWKEELRKHASQVLTKAKVKTKTKKPVPKKAKKPTKKKTRK